jgi:predicted membrane-bound spermidine synthase
MNRVHFRHYGGIFLVSFATLLLELTLIRVLAVASWYHFGFLVISMALLAFGASGVTLSLWGGLRERASIDRVLAILSLAFGLTTMASFWLMQHIPFHPFNLLLDWRQLLLTPVYYLAIAAPFFCSGLVIALLFTRFSSEVNRLYAADLLGAGIGCVSIVFIIPRFGGAGSITIAAVFGFMAAVVFGFSQVRRLAAIGVALGILAFSFAFVADKMLPISVDSQKHHPLQPYNRQPIYTAWNTFSRVDVYELSAKPQDDLPDSGYGIIIDAGAAGTAIPDLSGGVREYLARASGYRPSGITYLSGKPSKVLIIGSGAGREVLEGLYFGASSITAVEINPLINNIATRHMRSKWGDLFEQPEVRLVTGDGRSFVRRSNEKYDSIIAVQTFNAAGLASGALGLSETYVLTREAFADYLDHLTPDGILLITRGTSRIPRLFATAREVFEERGLGSPAAHLFAFRGPVAPFGTGQSLSGFMLKKSAFTVEEVQTLTDRLKAAKGQTWTGEGEAPQPEIFYTPFGSPHNWYQSLLYDLAAGPDLKKIYAASSMQLAPVTDDAPFFEHVVRWTSLRPANFFGVFTAGKFKSDDEQPVAEITLVVLLLQVALVAGFLIVWPMWRFSRQGLRTPGQWAFLTYFAGLGLGFIMIEIVLLQRFTLFLGQPIFTFAVVLTTLLVSTGVGAYIAGQFRERHRHLLLWVVGAILLVLFVTAALTSAVFSVALGLSMPWRIVITTALVAPLGILLGMPFPIGLRIVSEEAQSLISWAWAVNGFFTVIGSVVGLMLGMGVGFRVVFALAGGCYLISLAAISISKAPPSFGGATLERPVDGMAGAR